MAGFSLRRIDGKDVIVDNDHDLRKKFFSSDSNSSSNSNTSNSSSSSSNSDAANQEEAKKKRLHQKKVEKSYDNKTNKDLKKSDRTNLKDKVKLRNSHLANKTHPVTGVKFDKDGFPIFESNYDMKLDEVDYKKSRNTHSSIAGKKLYQDVQKDFELKSKFTEEDLEIFKDGNVPKRFRWHHHQEPGKLQLVDKKIHTKTSHTGGYSIWGGDS